jgi:hypothetical protein
MHDSLWPLNIGGKSVFSWPAYIPVTFEVMVFFGAHITVIAFLILNFFPDSTPKILDPDLSKDKFALWISEKSNHFDEEEIQLFLKQLNAERVKMVKG